jgi:hypothetical protein
MSNYNKLNNIAGWFIFAIATLVYILTLEPTASFWDCGEFIAASYKLQVPHPPGAPMFLLIGRIFSLFASDVQHVAYMVNMVSALSSSFTILFLFWTITMLAKKIVSPAGTPTSGETISILGSAAIGALAFTFSDSFWFSAAEAEVYAMSSFFTAFVFWAILKWEAHAHEEDSDKWIILMAYMVGLSIGVHLLNLVALPAVAFVYYFKKHEVTTKGIIYTFLLSAGIIMVIMAGIIPGLPSIAGKFEIFFVNSLGMPFTSGTIFFVILFIGGLTYGIYYSIVNQKRILNLSLLCLVFILIGYASYGIILIRSNYNPPIDENDPENIISFVSYLKREQYGDRPLLRGPFFTASRPKYKKGAPLYRKDEKKKEYVIYGYKDEAEYASKDMKLFPRIYSTQPSHINAYKQKLDLKEGQKPTMYHNIKFLFTHQLGQMYTRYFLWNFSGRESDIQDAHALSPKEWFAKDIPASVKENKGRNNFYMLPLILGMIGLIFHFNSNKKDATIIAMLFFFTGIAIILYLNQPPIEPRERDYTYTGSFYAFTIWIGLGVLGIADLLKKIIANNSLRAIISTVICLIVPGIMAAEGWDDHDRSKRYHSVDSAKNLLESCAPNAVLFTGGDNDTFPLWYVQEVEGYRSDVRVCNLSLLNTDWYIEQMKRRAYESQPLPISLDYNHFIQGTNDYLYVMESPKFLNLGAFLSAVMHDDPEIKREVEGGSFITVVPSKKLYVPVDKEQVKALHIVSPKYENYITDDLSWTLSANAIEKKDLIILDMISTGKWTRPIYFSTTLQNSYFLNMKEYMQLEGLAYRLLPVKVPGAPQGWINSDIMYENMMHKYHWRNLDDPSINYDENYLRFPINARYQFSRLAEQLYSEDKKEKAKEVILHCLKVMPDRSIPYDGAIPTFIPLLFKLGEDKTALDIIGTMSKRAEENVKYYMKEANLNEVHMNLGVLQQLMIALKDAGKDAEAKKTEEVFSKYYEEMNLKFKMPEQSSEEGE